MLTYALDNRQGESLYGHLYRCLRSDIESGVIAPDEKLPSKRPFAKHLGVSLITVEGAYTQLLAEGYIRSVPRVGYFANRLQRTPAATRVLSPSSTLALLATSSSPSTLLTSAGTSSATPGSSHASAQTHVSISTSHSNALPVAPSTPSPSSAAASSTSTFPLTAWSHTVRDVLAHEPEVELTQPSPSMGLPRLQKALAQHVRAFRGLDVASEQILIASGAQTIYSLLIQLIGRNTSMAVENPGYSRLAQIYRCNGVPLSYISLDGEGISMAQLHASGAQAVHLMPSHQFPTGIVTPISRRYELLGWATEASGRYIIEDDYDCEFRLTGRPIPTLKSIDTEDCVIYTNTFTRSLGPSLRVGYAVLPWHLVKRYHQELAFYSNTVSTIEQLTLANFIETGQFERHINRVRTQCRTQRDKLLAALETAGLAGIVTLQGAEAGLHFLLTVSTSPTGDHLVTANPQGPLVLASPQDHLTASHQADASTASHLEHQIAQALKTTHIPAIPLSQFYMGEAMSLNSSSSSVPANSYVVAYADLTDEAIRALIRQLKALTV